MTLPSRHRMRNFSPGGLMPNTLPLGHGVFPQYWIFTIDWGRRILLYLWNLKAFHIYTRLQCYRRSINWTRYAITQWFKTFLPSPFNKNRFCYNTGHWCGRCRALNCPTIVFDIRSNFGMNRATPQLSLFLGLSDPRIIVKGHCVPALNCKVKPKSQAV